VGPSKTARRWVGFRHAPWADWSMCMWYWLWSVLTMLRAAKLLSDDRITKVPAGLPAATSPQIEGNGPRH
jgi:hypothetical protein